MTVWSTNILTMWRGLNICNRTWPNKLSDWAVKWQMNFNPPKCYMIRMMRRKEPIVSQYTMMGQKLQEVEHYPYLWVELANDLSWSHHVNNCTQKAHCISLNFLRRNITKCSTVTKDTAYKGMVRPETQNNHIHKVKRVQSKTIWFVLNQYDPLASVTQMRYQMKWPT